MPGLALGAVDPVVDVERAAGITGEGVEDACGFLRDRGAGNQATGGDCTSIDQRVQRSTGLGPQADGVESIAGGLDPDLRQHGVFSVFRQCEPIGQGLGNGLDAEGLAGIAYFVDESIMGGDADAERLRVCTRKFRDVAGDVAFRDATKAGVKRFQIVENG